MKFFSIPISFLFAFNICAQQTLYFPPKTGNTWENTSPAALGWRSDLLPELQTFLEASGTKSFLVLKDGRIVLEYYFNDHDATKPWYWASAGKSLTSILVAFAEAENKLELTDLTSKYLGKGWTTCSEVEENKITIWHQITMTSGLDDALCFDCLDANSLKCIADPGSRWAYHNSPYTLLDGVIEGATGQNLNLYFKQKLGDKIGMSGAFIMSGNNNVFYSTGRNAAKFGLFVLANGSWDGEEILNNPNYISQMKNSSQLLNPSYGYLWWLNGKNKLMLPGFQLQLNRDLNAFAPKDMFAALGKNDQKIYIVPSENLVVVRLGELGTTNDTPVPIVYDEELWQRLVQIMNLNTSDHDLVEIKNKTATMSNGMVNIDDQINLKACYLLNVQGKIILKSTSHFIETNVVEPGIYFLQIIDSENNVKVERIFIP